MKDKTLLIAVGLLCLAFLGIGLMAGYSLAPIKEIKTVEFVPVKGTALDTLKPEYVQKVDTKVNKPIKHDKNIIDTLLIVENHYCTDTVEVPKHDTIYGARPYISHFDSTAANARIVFNYLYPQNIITDLRIEPKQEQYLSKQTIYKERSIWIDILTHVGAGGVGFGIGYLVGAK